ncbi:thiamine-phosphate kinase [Methanotorris igneus]|uniref:Thiamine-monophosphate kinase n=1 Tax=Methanotorris igneus (strain DSM 5666 / JCM 11834 / Kol 5) TaxID=880724 RepID=F6BAP7_METIK|nr:thiamine-phosphate kinase [Methanotorris igneus]AEF95861.1 thiamine-monophosphate kinase [Methanotorris igneus Kol 5]
MNELEIINLISKNLTYKGNAIKSIGDDCAVFKINNTYLVITTDMMFKSTHFPDILTPFQIGGRLITANVSDIAAMCAKPLGIVVSIGISKEYANKKFIDELSKGLNFMAEKYKCPVVGGDTNKSNELTLCGTAFGLTDNPIYRRAEVGDDICITNDLGRVFCALKMIEMRDNGIINKNQFNKLMEKYPNIMKKLCEPEARVEEGILMNELVNSCCDISDGLAKDLFYIGGFEIYSEDLLKAVPEDVLEFCEEFNINPIEAVLNSGEEFELLFTTKKYLKVKEILKKTDTKVIKIGKVIEDGKYLDGNIFKFGGYIHRW